jgi:glycine cleavage system aminomethyltransferase T
MVMADWIVHGEPEYDLWKMDIRRFGRQYRSRRYARERAYEVYATYYDIHYPGEERQAGRPLKMAPTYSRLAALGAEFGEKSGWERANWFASNEDPAHESLRPRGWAGEHWSTAIVTEHVATRERAGLFDESSFAKIEVSGPGGVAFLQRLCANDVDRAPGAVVYTQLLNSRGGIECDLTASRLEGERFQLVSGTAFGNHDLGWIRKQLGDWSGDRVEVRDVTASLACLGLWGPRARDILGTATTADLSNEAFPYLSWRELVVGDVPCRALRVTYVGELGWELYPSVEYASRLWDTLIEAGAPHGLVPAGYRAIDTLRLEKGYRAWGSDITPEENPFEAGLGFAVRMDTPGFLGNEALERAQGSVAKRLSCLTLGDERAMCLGNEPVFHGGEVVSRVTSGGIGYSVGASIAYAYLPVALTEPATELEVEVFGDRVPTVVAIEPLWDPKGERIRD